MRVMITGMLLISSTAFADNLIVRCTDGNGDVENFKVDSAYVKDGNVAVRRNIGRGGKPMTTGVIENADCVITTEKMYDL